ncbi:dihydrolipoyl dehydrogenase family protein [Arthrobacter rhizosphaerae]|uniref:dihydrolipoyl dehydrogenase family protein n=1 Tax=Arthrobacter rhizosphaerae TaxID=2855490 RepID=UPI001FF5439B|nr:NAD(P)/FAD-dependent oxidoreductase [Arthrobacter rhizosphaerae]
MDYTYDVLVIGGGPAGMAAAERAAELGAKTAVVERSALGGTCLNSGCVPTRVLAKTARLYREVRTAFDYGIVVQEPAVDWKKTVTRVQETVQRVLEAKQYDAMMERLGIDLFSGQAMFTGERTVDVDGQELSARSIILCVGGAARRLPIAGAELSVLPEEVLTLTELPGRLAIIGGGHTGAQLTTIFNALGSEVLLLDVAQRLLLTEDHDVAAFVGQSFLSKGIRVETGIQGIEGITRTSDGSLGVTWTKDGEAFTAEVDTVIMAAGWPANIPGLGLEAAGVKTERSFIPVDDYLRTNVPHIFVAGDANGTSMLVQAAVFEGETAGSNAVLGANRTTPHHLLPEGGFTDPDYAGVGLTEEQARKRDSECRSVTVPYAAEERPIIDDRETGFLKLVTDRHGELILGAHAVGENAVEVVQAVASAMAAGTDLATLARVKFAYPTYSAIIGRAARAASRE